MKAGKHSNDDNNDRQDLDKYMRSVECSVNRDSVPSNGDTKRQDEGKS